MKCYRLNCKKECDKYKKAACIFKLTKVQQDLIAKIKGKGYCSKCGRKTIKANYHNMEIQLCTECGVRDLIA